MNDMIELRNSVTIWIGTLENLGLIEDSM
jgi:hypothetical protein